MGTLTSSQEHYLKAIFTLSSTSGFTRICDVAEELDVRKPSVCTAVKTLENMGLVKRDVHRQIILTPNGENQAYLIMNKLSIVRCYFIEVLGIDKDAAELDACAIENVLSNETLCSMCRQTGKDICSEDCYLKIETELREA
ncbi:MAG: metal-dependent transcriptional regulator [Clostridia bacterium]|nr:metal-dependent transcriptional regulator [Clostridia bacterium]